MIFKLINDRLSHISRIDKIIGFAILGIFLAAIISFLVYAVKSFMWGSSDDKSNVISFIVVSIICIVIGKIFE